MIFVWPHILYLSRRAGAVVAIGVTLAAGSVAIGGFTPYSPIGGGVHPPPSGNVLELSGTITAQSFVTQVEAAPAGPLTVRPRIEVPSFTVTGSFGNGVSCTSGIDNHAGAAADCVYIGRDDVTVQNAVFNNTLIISDGLTVEDSRMLAFDAHLGADDWTLQRDVIDPSCQVDNNVIYNSRNWRILDSEIANFHYCPNEGIHSEGLYVGSGNDGFLISGNYFHDQGSTGHIFFTWFPAGVDNPASYPKNGCVTANTFENVINNFHEIDMRNDGTFPSISTIHIDPDTNINLDAPGKELADINAWETACP